MEPRAVGRDSRIPRGGFIGREKNDPWLGILKYAEGYGECWPGMHLFRVVVGSGWGVRRNRCPDKTRVDIRVTACNHTHVGSNLRTERRRLSWIEFDLLSPSPSPASVSARSRSVSSLSSVLADVARDRYRESCLKSLLDRSQYVHP